MLILNVFVAGMCIMAIEMTAFRLLAPYFGTTQLIITNIIGCILLAIAIGNWIGGRLGDQYRSARGLSWILLASAFVGLIVFFATRPILGWAARSLSEQDLVSFGAALVITVFLFSIPFIFLGMISPYTVRLMTSHQEHVGRRAGTVFVLGTLGSLIGTYLPTFVFIPLLGSNKTFLLFIGILVITAFLGMFRQRSRAGTAAALGFAALLGLLPMSNVTMDNVIASDESLYNLIQVVEKDERRLLYLNEGHGYHSVYHKDRHLVGGVWDYFLALPAMMPRDSEITREDPIDVLIVGLAAGTVSNMYSHFFDGRVRIDGVEIDERITDMARQHFNLDTSALSIYHEDGRTFLSRPRGPYDIIIVDAYKQPYVPFHLTTREFFQRCRESLKPGGVLGINVATFDPDSRLLANIQSTMAGVFPELFRIEIGNFDVNFVNNIIGASNTTPHTANLTSRLADIPSSLLRHVEKSLRPVSVKPEDPVFTDDWAPVEWYVDWSLFNFFES